MLLNTTYKCTEFNRTFYIFKFMKPMGIKGLTSSVNPLLVKYNVLKPLLKKSYHSSHLMHSNKVKRKIRNNITTIESDSLQKQLMLDVITLGKPLSNEGVVNFKTNVLSQGKTINNNNIDTIFLTICALEKALEVGRSYFLHLHKTNVKLNVASVGKFFYLCYVCKDICTEEDKRLILEVYKNLITEYKILDSGTCENALLGLSITRNWKEGLKLMEICELSDKPSTKMHNALIISSFNNNDTKLGWKLIRNTLETNRKLIPEVYSLCILRNNGKDADFFFELLEENNVQISVECGETLVKSYQTIKPRSRANLTSISNKGYCLNCHKPLTNINLTNNEFEELRRQFLNPVLIGKNVFLKTKPAELNNFLDFIEEIGRVDVVLDGLNVAYTVGKKKGDINNKSHLLCQVTKHFVNMGKRVLIIGRKHMSKWPNMSYIEKNSLLFLTDNISADDPFILYAAMRSGLGTIFVSRDQMRSHRFLLKEPKIRTLFIKWQQIHQYYLKYVTSDGRIVLQDPLPYLINIQKNDNGSWHFPITCSTELKTGVPGHLIPQITSWLCLP